MTVVVYPLAVLNSDLEKGCKFGSSIIINGLLLYAANGVLVALPGKINMEIAGQETEKYWHQNIGIARRFLKSAKSSLDESWPEQAMFNLHQCAQHTCMAMLRFFTGYRSTTHNLSRLFGWIENFTDLLIPVFPCITDEETQLFNLLNRAYSEARYKDSYVVPMETARIIEKRIVDLMSTAEFLYKEHAMVSEKDLSFPVSVGDVVSENSN